MNLRSDAPVLLRVRCPLRSEGLRERLLTALVAHYEVVGVHEFEDQDGMWVQVSFGERAWPSEYDQAYSAFGFEDVVAPLDVEWRRYPELTSLITAHAGQALEARFGGEGVTCELCVPRPWIAMCSTSAPARAS